MTQPQRLHHVGIPVSDLPRSLAWYQRVLGLVQAGGVAEGSGEQLSRIIQVPDARIDFTFLRVGDHLLLELIELKHPKPKPYTAANGDVGAVHVCFLVDDIDAAYRDLTAAGVEFNAPPMVLGPDTGELEGNAFAYFRDPDGIQLELWCNKATP